MRTDLFIYVNIIQITHVHRIDSQIYNVIYMDTFLLVYVQYNDNGLCIIWRIIHIYPYNTYIHSILYNLMIVPHLSVIFSLSIMSTIS